MPLKAKQVRAFLRPVSYYHKFIKNFAWIAKPFTALTHHNARFVLTSSHLTAFTALKSALLEASVLHYPDPQKCYIVYTNALDDALWSSVSQEHDGQDVSVPFLSCTFTDTFTDTCTDTQCKWSAMEQEAYGIYYVVPKGNNYVQGGDIAV